jgi:hypothetical protein
MDDFHLGYTTFHHVAWAHAQVRAAILACSGPPPPKLSAGLLASPGQAQKGPPPTALVFFFRVFNGIVSIYLFIYFSIFLYKKFLKL